MHDAMICAKRKAMSSAIAVLPNDAVCVSRKYVCMKKQNVKHAKWVSGEFARTKKPKGGLAKALGIDSAGVTRLLKGNRDITVDEQKIIQDYFTGGEDGPSLSFPDAIPEIDVRFGAGAGGVPIDAYISDGNGGHTAADGVKENWGIPHRFVRNELRSTPSVVRIAEVLGDSMEPALRSGDRVMIDTNHKSPSPPGVYAVWDGFGLVIKRVEIVPRSSPTMVRLISDNSHHAVYEVSLDDAQIVGRVICKISAM